MNATEGRRAAVEILVIGGGPSGAMTASLLATAGASVALIHRPRRRLGVEETVLASAEPLLTRLGIRPFFRRAAAEHQTAWTSPTAQTRKDDASLRALQCVRAELDLAIAARALRSGVRVEETEGLVSIASDPPTVSYRTAKGIRSLEAQFLVVATGRALPAIVRPFVTTSREEPRLIALTGWSAAPAASATTIAAIRSGWVWRLPLLDDRNLVTIFVDGDELREVGQDAALIRAQSEIRSHFDTGNVVRTGATDATPRLRESHASRVFLCGDSAATLDPLSSQGLEKALTSAESVAAALLAVLHGAVSLGLAQTWIAAEHAETYLVHAARARRLYGEVHPSVRGKFHDRRTPTPEAGLPIRWRLRSDAEMGPWPVKHAGRLRVATGLLRNGGTRGVHRIGSLDAGMLHDLFRDAQDLDTVLQRARSDARCVALRPSDVLAACEGLHQLGYLEPLS